MRKRCVAIDALTLALLISHNLRALDWAHHPPGIGHPAKASKSFNTREWHFQFMEALLKSLSSLGALFLVAALTACGGGGGNTVNTGGGGGNGDGNGGGNGGDNGGGGGDPVPTLLNSTPQIIEYHGDSTIWGYRSNTDGARVDTPAPAAFAAALPSHHQVHNLGRNRTTVCDLLNGTDAYQIEPAQPRWQEHINNSDATVVIINHGINDIRYSLNDYRRCLDQVVDIAQEAGKVVILETPNPVADVRIDEFVTTMREVASQQGTYLIDQYANLKDRFDADPLLITPDGTHPAEAIYIEKGRYAASVFETFESP